MNSLQVSCIVGGAGGFSIPPEFHSAAGTFVTSGFQVNLSGDPPPDNRLRFKILAATGSPDPTVALCYADFTSGNSGAPCEVIFKWDGADYSDASQITSSGYNYAIGPATPASNFAWKRMCCPAIAGSSFWDTPVNIWNLQSVGVIDGPTALIAPADVTNVSNESFVGIRLARGAGVRTFTGTYSGSFDLGTISSGPTTSGTIREAFSILRAEIASSSILSQAAAYNLLFLTV